MLTFGDGMAKEYLDVLDWRGNKTGTSMVKEDVHYQGKWFGSVHVWIYNSKGEVLLQQRAKTKQAQHLKWGVSCGGHMAAGELPIESAIRELREETGLRLPRSAFKYVGAKKSYGYEPDAKWYTREFISVYLVRYDGPERRIRRQISEVESLQFIPIRVFAKRIANKKSRAQFMNYSKAHYVFAIREIKKALKGQ
jgi:isopentenyl-diphosphate Delta-isomerase